MSKIFQFVLLIISNITLISSACKDNTNHCEKCNPLTNLCAKCSSDNYISDNEGGCTPKCTIGKNYCYECDKEEKLCQSCQFGYFPDKIGGCSLTENCESSYKGVCLECDTDYILVGDENFKICKNLYSEDLKNCLLINTTTGICENCKEGFFLNQGDFKCIESDNCYESFFGVCTICIEGYYLNKIREKCLKIEDPFFNCKETINEKTCDTCINYYNLAKDGQCVKTLECSESQKGECIKCNEGYFLTENNYCIDDENCQIVDIDLGLCSLCKQNYYLDNKDRKCKPNTEENEYKYCKIYNNGCKECIEGYYPAGDKKCVSTQKCAKSENGTCIECSKNYYLGLDNHCSSVEHCIYSGKDESFPCDECDTDYYFLTINSTCVKGEGKFEHCMLSLFQGASCAKCHEGYYLNETESKCYDNTKENEFYKCEKTDYRGKFCDSCEKNYYIGRGDNKCTSIENCKSSESVNKCTYCNDYYCLDQKQQKCYDNDFLENPEKLFYIACLKTNEEGTACIECIDGYELDDRGYCIDITRCVKRDENGNCIKCQDDNIEDERYYCANSIYGCIQTFLNHCIKCDNLTNLYSCTQCEKGYETNYYGFCING